MSRTVDGRRRKLHICIFDWDCWKTWWSTGMPLRFYPANSYRFYTLVSGAIAEKLHRTVSYEVEEPLEPTRDPLGRWSDAR